MIRATITRRAVRLAATLTAVATVAVPSAAGAATPSIRSASPANGATGVNPRAAVTAEVNLPNSGAGVDETTLDAGAKLYKVSGNVEIPSNRNTSGGTDVVVVQPKSPLQAFTQYRFEVTNKLKDQSGAGFAAFSSTFTTGPLPSGPGVSAKFTKSAQPKGDGKFVTSVLVSPDGKWLYAATFVGQVLRFPINSDGSLGDSEVLRTYSAGDGTPDNVIGLALDPSSSTSYPILWVTHSDGHYVGPGTTAVDWSGKLSRLNVPLKSSKDYIVGLPRSAKDHETNSIAFGLDGALYLNQGSMSAMGARDSAWGNRDEHELSAAVLRIAPSFVDQAPGDFGSALNVKTADGGGSYDPFAPGAPVTIYASGIRNAYDLVWHTNGHLYVPTNGSAAGGNTPKTPATLPAACSNRIDSATSGPWTGPAVPATNSVDVQPDLLFDAQQGKYYGHPNPTRCEYAFFGANPTSGTDHLENTLYPVGTQPDRNYAREAFNLGEHASANGALEYCGTQWNNELRGMLLVTRYSAGKDIIALRVSDTGAVTQLIEGIPGLDGFANPLDIAQDPKTGNIYVTDLPQTAPQDSSITLLKPNVGAAAEECLPQKPQATPTPDPTPVPTTAPTSAPVPTAAPVLGQVPAATPTPAPQGPQSEGTPIIDTLFFGTSPRVQSTRTLKLSCRLTTIAIKGQQCRVLVTLGKRTSGKKLTVKRARFKGKSAKLAVRLGRTNWSRLTRYGATFRIYLLDVDGKTKLGQAKTYYKPKKGK